MAKQYRTARGKGVDLSQILNDNEHVRAVGNMNVNARGDTIDSQNKTVQSRNDRVKNQYRKQHKNTVVDDTVPTSKRHAEKLAKVQANVNNIAQEYTEVAQNVALEKSKKLNPEPVVEEVADPVETVAPVTEAMQENAPTPKGGLAAAIAKARESKQEIMKTERQEARESEGVKRF